MQQYDIIRITNSVHSPYVLVLQHDINSNFPTVIVAPIMRLTSDQFVAPLNFKVEIEGQDFTVVMQELSAMPRSRLRNVVANRVDLHDAVMAALDQLFTGF